MGECGFSQAEAGLGKLAGKTPVLIFPGHLGGLPGLGVEEVGRIKFCLVRRICESWGGCCNLSSFLCQKELRDSGLCLKTALTLRFTTER